MKHLLKILLFLLPIAIFCQDEPNWLTKKPQSNSFNYVGIGQASLLDDNYAVKAEEMAFRSIAQEINVSISSLTKDRTIERNGIVDYETFDQFIVSTLSNLKGVKKKGDHIDKKKNLYYVYFEYSRSEHLNNIKAAKQRAISLVEQYSTFEKEEYIQRLQRLVNAYEELFQIYGEDVYADVNGLNTNLQSFVPAEISKMIRQIVIDASGQTQLKGVFQQPLNDELAFQVKAQTGPRSTINAFGLPFIFEFEAGSGNFSFSNVISDEYGFVTNGLLKITSNIPRQVIVSRLDLTQLKTYRTPFYHLDKSLAELSKQKKVNFTLDVSLVKSDRVSIWVKSSGGISNMVVRNINDSFDIAFKKLTEFELVDRQNAEAILDKKNLSSADVCNSSECRVQLGKDIGVDKFVLIDISYSSRTKLVTATLRYANVVRNISEEIRKYDAKVKGGDFESAIYNNIDRWVEDFYGVLNPPSINLASNVSGVRVTFGSYREFLPLIDYEVNPGNYEFVFEKNGYESKSRKENLFPNDVCCDDVVLKKKTRTKAFIRSTLLPGSGQRYGKDNRNQNVGRKSLIHTATNGLLAAGTLYAWYAFSNNQKKYDNAQITYSKSTTIIDIDQTRKAAQIANENLKQSQTNAVTLTALMMLFSVYSGVDAAVTLPDYE